MWFDEVKETAITPEKLYKNIATHNLPVVVYGATQTAADLTEMLHKHDIEVDKYVIDDEYFTPNKTYLGKPIVSIKSVLTPPPPPGGEECVCVLGIDAQNNRILNKKLNQRIKTILSSKQIHFYNILPERCNKGIEPLTIDYIESRFEEFNETYSLLADEKSKYSLVSWLKLRCSYDTAAMFDTYDENQYFNELIQGFPLDKYIDCGAYTGDMIERFVEFTNGNYNKIYAVEPIPGNLKELENLVATKNYKNVEIIKKGTSNHKDIVNFFDGGEGSRIDNKKDDGIAVEIDTIDNILNGDTVSLIKMDIEGSELDSLKGASKTIEKCMPVLTLSAYHKVEDLITLPKFIKQFHNNSKHYEFYLRHHWITVPYDLVLYALPVED